MIELKHCLSVGLLLFASASCWAQKLELFVQTGYSNSINSVEISLDGKTLATDSGDNTIRLWDLSQGIPRAFA